GRERTVQVVAGHRVAAAGAWMVAAPGSNAAPSIQDHVARDRWQGHGGSFQAPRAAMGGLAGVARAALGGAACAALSPARRAELERLLVLARALPPGHPRRRPRRRGVPAGIRLPPAQPLRREVG